LQEKVISRDIRRGGEGCFNRRTDAVGESGGTWTREGSNCAFEKEGFLKEPFHGIRRAEGKERRKDLRRRKSLDLWNARG